jgi:hypothetical protein
MDNCFLIDTFKHISRYLELTKQILALSKCKIPPFKYGEAPVSRFVGTLFNAYVQVLSRQKQRSGALYEGRFKHVHVDRETYLLQLCRYIHANPVKAGLVTESAEWPYSNYQDWIGARPGTLIDQEFVNVFSLNRKEYRRFVLDYLHRAHSLPEELKGYLLG